MTESLLVRGLMYRCAFRTTKDMLSNEYRAQSWTDRVPRAQVQSNCQRVGEPYILRGV